MPTQTLSARHYIYFTYSFQRNSLRRASIKYYVESEYPVDIFVVDDINFQKFQAVQEYQYYGVLNVNVQRQEHKPTHEGNWYLVINNNQNKDTAIHYEVT